MSAARTSTPWPEPRPLADDAAGGWVRHWQRADWAADVDAWVADALGRRGITQTGPGVAYKLRFWSVVRYYPTDAGPVWFKENNPGQGFEAQLVAALTDLVPDLVVPPLATRADTGWLLTTDQGTTLFDSGLIDRRDIRLRLLRELAALQRALTDHADAAPATGLTTVSPALAGSIVRERLSRLLALPEAHPLRPDADLARRVRQASLRLDAFAEEFSGAIPLTLEHNDLHGRNVFGSADGPLRLFDFGDALWAHPFTTVHGFLGSLFPDLAADSPEGRELVEAYLACWSDRDDPVRLWAEFERAGTLLPVNRLVSWHRLLDHADLTEVTAWLDSPRYWLSRVAEA